MFWSNVDEERRSTCETCSFLNLRVSGSTNMCTHAGPVAMVAYIVENMVLQSD